MVPNWLDPGHWPFIPVPLISVDPNSGTTLGLIPTWLRNNDKGEISTIIAPDVLYNPYFGYGGHARVLAFPSEDTQWSVLAGAEERVESTFDLEYQTGRERNTPWSITGSVVYDRSGTPRFYGIGNETPQSNESNYTEQQKFVAVQVGLNLTHAWQVSYLLRARQVDVTPGTLQGIQSTTTRYPDLDGLGSQNEVLNRISIAYDTRDDSTVPRNGAAAVLYAGVATSGFAHSTLYSEVGIDLRGLWALDHASTLAAHLAARFMPGDESVPFWSLSNIGGDQSVLDGSQPLRGYGAGRFSDRNSVDANIEYRRRMLSINALSTRIELEIAPFIDLGQVYAQGKGYSTVDLHHVAGLGFRGIASPFIVGFVDVGYGDEGLAVFTGLNYPF